MPMYDKLNHQCSAPLSTHHLSVPAEVATKRGIIQLCSGITCGRVLNGEYYSQTKLQELIYLHLSTDCFMKIMKINLHETVCR